MSLHNFQKISELLESSNYIDCRKGLNILKESDASEAAEHTESLLKILRTDNFFLQSGCIEVIIRHRLQFFCSALREIAINHTWSLVIRENAVRALGILKDPDSISLLLKIMTETSDSISLYAREALSGFKNAKKQILDYLKNSFSERLQKENLISLYLEISDSDHPEDEIRASVSGLKSEEKTIIEEILSCHNRKKTAEEKSFSPDRVLSSFNTHRAKLEDYLHMIHAIDQELSLNLLVALKKVENNDFTLLEKLLFSVENVHALSIMVSILPLLESAAVLPFALNFLHHPDRRIRANTVEIIAEIPGIDEDSIIQMLSPMLEDSDHRVIANTARSLWKLGGLQMLEILKRLAFTGSKWMKASAAYALGEIGVFQVVEILIDMLQFQDHDIRRNTIIALGKTSDPEIIPPLLKIASCQEEDFSLRKLALDSIRKVGNRSAMNALSDFSVVADDPACRYAKELAGKL